MQQSVLLVEDDDSIRETVRTILEMEGYRVQTAANGKEALEQISRLEESCLVLLDLMMPVMNGWEFLKHLKRHPGQRLMPVVVVSAVADNPAAMTREGAAEVLRKPPDIDALLQLVGRYCDRQTSSAA